MDYGCYTWGQALITLGCQTPRRTQYLTWFTPSKPSRSALSEKRYEDELEKIKGRSLLQRLKAVLVDNP